MRPVFTEGLGLLAAAITTLCWVPQALSILRTRDTRSLSLSSQVALTCGVALWLGYGLIIGSAPIIAANAVTLVLVAAILAMKIHFIPLESRTAADREVAASVDLTTASADLAGRRLTQ